MITKKKDGSPGVLVDCRAVKMKLKADKVSLLKIEERTDDAAGLRNFSKLELDTSHWKVRLAENVQKIMRFFASLNLSRFK